MEIVRNLLGRWRPYDSKQRNLEIVRNLVDRWRPLETAANELHQSHSNTTILVMSQNICSETMPEILGRCTKE
jgi:hypothetical protein